MNASPTMLEYQLIQHDDHAHHAAVAARTGDTTSLKVRADRFGQRRDQVAEGRLLDQAFRAPTTAKKILWLGKAAEAVNRAAAGLSACKEGCTHCCHIGVVISEAEARSLAKATGRSLSQPIVAMRGWSSDAGGVPLANPDMAALQRRSVEHHFGSPCPFLDNDSCSAYEVRPLACRNLLNIDRDDLLCRLVDGEPSPVPYADVRLLQVAALMSLGPTARYADIRDWFDQPGL